mmetsp:Transcript_47079/g.118590  ORF Transcript_47079/g.118590 Transcript_47079/m.118590 type:complete len:217 (+) Transcript_47079:205-855(+)
MSTLTAASPPCRAARPLRPPRGGVVVHQKNSRRIAETEFEPQIEEWEIAGQTRVRACSLLEDGYASALSSVYSRRNQEDVDDDLEIEDDDTSTFGNPQYTNDDLVPIVIDDVSEDSGPEQCAQANTQLTSPTSLSENGSRDLLIASLKQQLKEQEASLSSIPKCMICLGAYTVPLVSVNCWHVHCEQCWMQALGAKKLCPQCQVITVVTDLRRVYL